MTQCSGFPLHKYTHHRTLPQTNTRTFEPVVLWEHISHTCFSSYQTFPAGHFLPFLFWFGFVYQKLGRAAEKDGKWCDGKRRTNSRWVSFRRCRTDSLSPREFWPCENNTDSTARIVDLLGELLWICLKTLR